MLTILQEAVEGVGTLEAVIGAVVALLGAILAYIKGKKDGVKKATTVAGLLLGCILFAGCPSPQKAFVEAERAHYNLIASWANGYLAGEPDAKLKADREGDLALWDTGISVAERSAK